MYMYRKVSEYLKQWKDSKYRKPLIIQGARQVGKTYAILEFGHRYYDNVAYFNFQTSETITATFDENISPSYLLPILSHISRQTITRGNTLIVFDEIQLCERAVASLKYFCEEAPEYHVIAAGSLLGVAFLPWEKRTSWIGSIPALMTTARCLRLFMKLGLSFTGNTLLSAACRKS